MAIRTYKVTLDTKNAIAPEPVYLRQGDKTGAVVIDATLMDNGAPVSLDGLTPMFKANTADGQAVIADSTGFNIVNASGGEFTYQVPNALSSVNGKIVTAYFSFSDSSGSESTFDVPFVIKSAVDINQKQAEDYITIIDGTLDSLRDQMDSLKIDFNKIINNYNMGDFYNKQETDSKDKSTLASAKSYTDDSINGVISIPETFTNLAAIKSKYPNGAHGVMVAGDNGHKYIWDGNAWADAGVYQGVGIANDSIVGKNIQDNTISVEKVDDSFVKTSVHQSLQTDMQLSTDKFSHPVDSSVNGYSYIQPEPVTGTGVLEFKSIVRNKGTYTFFTAKRDPGTKDFKIVSVENVQLQAGINSTITRLAVEGVTYYGMVINDGAPMQRIGEDYPMAFATPSALDIAPGISFTANGVGVQETEGFFAKIVNEIDLPYVSDRSNDASQFLASNVRQTFDVGSASQVASSTTVSKSQTLQGFDPDVWSFWGVRMGKYNINFDGLSTKVQLSSLNKSLNNYRFCALVRDTTSGKNSYSFVGIDPSADYSKPTTIFFHFGKIFNLADGLIFGISIVDSKNIAQNINSTGVVLTDGIDQNLYNDGSGDLTHSIYFSSEVGKTIDELAYSHLNSSSSPAHSYTGIEYELFLGKMDANYQISDPSMNAKLDSMQSSIDKLQPTAPNVSQLMFRKTKGNFDTQPNVYFSGRWFETANGITTINQGAEIDARFSGTSIAADITALATMPCLAASIDGGTFERVQMTSSGAVSIASGLDNTEHNIRLIIDGVDEHDDLWSGHKGVVFNRFIVNNDESVKTVPIKPNNRVVWFIGDSITAGINVLGKGANPSVNSATHAYAFVCSTELNVSNIRIAFGSTGVTTGGSGGVPQVSGYIDNEAAGIPDGVDDYPDVIVINHGTNDAGAGYSDFVGNYRSVLNRLNIKFPGVVIYLMKPFNGAQKYTFEAISSGYKNVVLVPSDEWNIASPNDGHPDVSNSITAGMNLAETLKKSLGTGYFFN